MLSAWRFHAVIAGALLLAAPHNTPAAEPDDLASKRAAFRSVHPEVERGNWQPVLQHEQLLRDYVLWPDLRAAYFRARLQNVGHAEVQTFLDRYGMLKPARELRYQFALHLAAAGRMPEYLEIYRQYYAELNIARLDCLALAAEIQAGNHDAVVNRGLELWLTGNSQADECDAVFSHLRERGVLGSPQFEQRFALAIEARRFSLARYLSRSLDGNFLAEANRWLDAQNNAEQFLSSHRDRPDSALGREQLIYALERIAYADPLLAAGHWTGLQQRYPFTAGQRQFIGRHIALWAARWHLPAGASMLRQLPLEATDTEVRRWLIRTALLSQAWDDVLRAIAALPDAEQQAEEWRYWEAMALGNAGQQAPSTAKLTNLAATRSFYGFLAADATGNDYAFGERRLVADDEITARLAVMPALVRARELFYVGIEGRGRSEWDAAVNSLTPLEQTQAAVLAHRWGWHSRAIATAAALGEFDDLAIRYPLPWREDFARYSADANINDSWAYGIARSESLFMRDIRSSAGAIGIMQILPETGRRMAREIAHPYAGRATLTDSSSNIRLGTMYLQKMFKRFDDNRVLATAAYNAGPLKVDAWLPDTKRLDARIWIENIPYNETRSYVRRVLTADAIFHWRMTGQVRRISTLLTDIDPAAGQVASSD